MLSDLIIESISFFIILSKNIQKNKAIIITPNIIGITL